MKTPRAYQTQAIERGARANLLLADACGLGKTLTAIETAKRVQAESGKPVLIIAPSETVKLQWLNELQSQGIAAGWVHWLDSKTPRVAAIEMCQIVPFCPTYVLTHYEAVRKHIDALAHVSWAMVICDEAHRIKNRKALRTLAIKQLRADRKLALTGTPYDRNPADIWSILNWLDPRFFSSYWRFFDAHVNYKEQPVRGGKTVKTPLANPLRDPSTFSRVLRPYMMQRKKEEVRADMPPRNDIFVDLQMGKAQAATYKKIVDARDPIVELAPGLETTVAIVLSKILRLIQVTTDQALLGLPSGHSVKLDWVREWLEDNPNESVIIFTRFRETAIALQAELGDSFKLIVGGNRAAVDSSVTRIIGTISAMGEGLDLPHIDNAIFIDVEWSSILMQQAIDRIHRINITNAKNVYFLRCANTVDALLHRAIAAKWSTKEIVDAFLKGAN